MTDQTQNALLLGVAVCAVLALFLTLWQARAVRSLRRQRFVPPTVSGQDESGGARRRSMSTREGQTRRYTAPAVRTGVDQATLKRALQRSTARQQQALETMKQDLGTSRREVAALRREFEQVQQRLSSQTQAMNTTGQQAASSAGEAAKSSSVAAKSLKDVRNTIATLDKKLTAHERQLREVRAAHDSLDAARRDLTQKGEQLAARSSRQEERLRELDRSTSQGRQRLEAHRNEVRERLEAQQKEQAGAARGSREIRAQLTQLEKTNEARLSEVEKAAGADRKRLEEVDRGLGGVAATIRSLREAAQRAIETGEGVDRSHRDLAQRTMEQAGQLAALQESLGSALQDVAMVRYDAFGDLGGRMSFSVALLDGSGDGLILTSLNGRSHSQTYAKSIVGGRGSTALSAEEEQAVAAARGEHQPTA